MIDEKIINRMRYLKSFGSDFDTAEDVDEFLELINKMELIENPDYLPYLMEFLDDDCYIDGVNETLLNNIGDSPARYFVPSLLKNLTKVYDKAPNQCEYLFWTIFNTPECFSVLKKNVDLADKETLLKVLQDIENDEPLPEHVLAIKELRQLLNSDK